MQRGRYKIWLNAGTSEYPSGTRRIQVTYRRGGIVESEKSGWCRQSAGKTGSQGIDWRNPQRPYAGRSILSEEMVRSPWRRGELGGTETT